MSDCGEDVRTPEAGGDSPGPGDDDDFGVDGATRLRRVILRLARAMNEPASSENLTPTQASVLGAVIGRGPITATELARIEGVNPTMLSRVLGALEERALVVRSAHEGDQRKVVAGTTDAGRETYARIRERRARMLVDVVDGLSPQVSADLVTALPSLEVLAEAIRDRPGAR